MQYNLISSPWVRKVTPIALTAAAGLGVAGTAILAAKATPKALAKKEEAEAAKGEPLTNWEKFKAMAPSYLPAASAGAATIGAIAGIHVLNVKEQAKLSAIIASGNQIINRVSQKYGMLHDTVKEKAPDIIEEFDKKTLDDEWEEYVNERMKKKALCIVGYFPDMEGEDWGERQMFCLEYGNGLEDENKHEMIFFEGTPGEVLGAFYNVNLKFATEGFARFNDIITELHLPKTDLGEHLVWDADVLFDEWGSCWIGFDTKKIPLEDDVPQPVMCTQIVFNVEPLAEGYGKAMDTPSRLMPHE